ncbi:hypothetical protein K438DRAFT_849639 [Mycena galopus ATCC 62051]|nr:hypothetical protein K438DRAFT_849639 [Mycena galopus ATCC 62051]
MVQMGLHRGMHMLDVGCGVGVPAHATCRPLLKLLKTRFIRSDTTYHLLRLVETLTVCMPLFRTPRLSAPRWDSFTIVRHLKDFPRYCTATPPPLMQLKAVLLGPAHHHRRHCTVCPVRTSVRVGRPALRQGQRQRISPRCFGGWGTMGACSSAHARVVAHTLRASFRLRRDRGRDGMPSVDAANIWPKSGNLSSCFSATHNCSNPLVLSPSQDPPPPGPLHEVGMGMGRQAARRWQDAASQAVIAAGCVLMSSRDATCASGQRLLDFRGRSWLKNSWLAPLDILQLIPHLAPLLR